MKKNETYMHSVCLPTTCNTIGKNGSCIVRIQRLTWAIFRSQLVPLTDAANNLIQLRTATSIQSILVFELKLTHHSFSAAVHKIIQMFQYQIPFLLINKPVN